MKVFSKEEIKSIQEAFSSFLKENENYLNNHKDLKKSIDNSIIKLERLIVDNES